MSSSPLIAEMQTERRKWARSTVTYGTVNVVTRVFLILASGIVAAEKNLSDSHSGFLVKWVPLLALGVTVITAFDTWLKPRDKWRGFMEDRDDLSDLLIRSQESAGVNAASFDQLRQEFGELRRRHRNKNVY